MSWAPGQPQGKGDGEGGWPVNRAGTNEAQSTLRTGRHFMVAWEEETFLVNSPSPTLYKQPPRNSLGHKKEKNMKVEGGWVGGGRGQREWEGVREGEDDQSTLCT